MNNGFWKFETKNYKVVATAVPDEDLDLSFDDTGEVRRGLESGRFVAFGVVVKVFYRGQEIGQDSLWGCIYESAEKFRDHLGIKQSHPGAGSYFSDMVREAVSEARKVEICECCGQAVIGGAQ